MKNIGERIRERRKALKLTQVKLGKMCGVSGPTVSDWEAGEMIPKTESLFLLAKALKETPDWLMTGDKPSISPGPPIQDSVPLISSVQAGEWSEIVDNFQPGDAEEWRETTAKVSSNSFALRVEGDSMLNPPHSPNKNQRNKII